MRTLHRTALLAVLAGGAAPAAPPARTPCDTVVEARWVVTVDAAATVVEDGAVAIARGRIVAVGKRAEVAARFAPKVRIDRRNAAVLPGFVNTHGHAAMTLFRGIADDLPLMQWLRGFIFPAEAKNVTPEFVTVGTELACLEMIRGGTTTFADMYYFESDVAAAVERSGMRGVLGETWLDFPTPGHKDLAEMRAVTEAFLSKWRGHPRVTAAVAPHAPYTCSKETLLAAKDLAGKYGAPMLIHVSETQDEQKQIREKYGTTPVKWLDSIGFLGPNVLAAHGVWLDDEDLKILASLGTSVSHNPESNMKLASGIAPVVKARAAGVVVGLGTDGVAGSNNDLEMLDAMDFASKLAKVSTMDSTVLPAKDLLRMATLDGARALGLGARTGSLEEGKAADLVAIDFTSPRLHPVYDVVSHLVSAAKGSDVTLTMVDGKVLWDGTRVRTLDRAKVVAAADAFRKRILDSLREAK